MGEKQVGKYPNFLTYIKVIFSLFQTNITTILCEKCPSNIRCWDLNPRPLDCKSPRITTRPGLPPQCDEVCNTLCNTLQLLLRLSSKVYHTLETHSGFCDHFRLSRVSLFNSVPFVAPIQWFWDSKPRSQVEIAY